MAYYDTPMSKLDAVNICLNSIGESSIQSLVSDVPPDAQLAADLVDETSRSFLNIGWHWNREIIKLTPDVDGYLQLPANISRVRSINGSISADVVQRGTKLYDKSNNTFVFTAGTIMEVEVYLLLPFDDLVQQAREYIAYRSAMVFQQRIHASDTEDKMLKERVQSSWIQLVRAENQVGRPNMLRDNWAAASILNRGSFSRGLYR
jgi:hypothetical protein